MAEQFIANTGARRIEGVGGPFYRPSTDTIHMPDRRSFTSEEAFYATADRVVSLVVV